MGSVTTGRARPADQLGVELPVPIRVPEYRLRHGHPQTDGCWRDASKSAVGCVSADPRAVPSWPPRTRGHLGPRWRLRRDHGRGLPAVAEASELRRCCDKMRSMREAKVTPTIADRFEAIIGGDRFSQFSQLADTTRERFLGRTIWNINAAETGGVAEMLRGLVATAIGLGIDTRWLVIDGNPKFFAITKRIHNTVHGSPGDGGPLGDAERRRYESVVGANRERLHELVSPGDIVVLHDPQTAGMVEM